MDGDPEFGNSEMDFGAYDYGDYILNTLSRLGKSHENLLFLVGDNCSVNELLASKLGIPLVGCASHRLNLATERMHESQEYKLLIRKINGLAINYVN